MSTLVIGIGHPDRGDDAVGRMVATRLAARAPADVTVLEHDGETAGLLDRLGRAETVILIDAAMSGEAAGSIQRFDVVTGPLPSGCFLSTHGMGLAEAVELARVLGQMPRRCVVYAVEARAFDHGAPLSPEVAAAVDDVVARIVEELATAPSRPVILRCEARSTALPNDPRSMARRASKDAGPDTGRRPSRRGARAPRASG
jgi:hydrogenase maturation protease